MKFVKLLAPLFLVCMMCSAFTMKDKTNGMYIVGVSASFTDSVIYFTDVQFVKNLSLGNDKLLEMRSHYSDQLDEYLESEKGLINRTSFVYYNDKKEKLEERRPKSWCKSVSAFANGNGGSLIFGVTNDDELVGLENAESDAEKIRTD